MVEVGVVGFVGMAEFKVHILFLTHSMRYWHTYGAIGWPPDTEIDPRAQTPHALCVGALRHTPAVHPTEISAVRLFQW